MRNPAEVRRDVYQRNRTVINSDERERDPQVNVKRRKLEDKGGKIECKSMRPC